MKNSEIRSAKLSFFQLEDPQDGTVRQATGVELELYGEPSVFFLDDKDEIITNPETKRIAEEHFHPDHHESVIKAFLQTPYTPIVTVYERSQYYGGAEEGGWWYHNDIAVDTIPLEAVASFEEENKLDSHGEGFHVRIDFIYGSKENRVRPYYC